MLKIFLNGKSLYSKIWKKKKKKKKIKYLGNHFVLDIW